MIWKNKVTLEKINALCQDNLAENLGIEFTEIGADYLLAAMPVDERTRQPMGLLHGGASVALAETMGSVASTLTLEDTTKQMAVGVEINANHLRPVFSGKITGKVRPIRVGRKIQVWQIDMKDDRGKLNCVSRLTIAIVPRK